MPILLPQNTLEESNTLTTSLERQLKQGSIQAAFQLTSTTGYGHGQGSCYHCDKVANYYLLALRIARHQRAYDALVLSLVQGAIELVQTHVDISRLQHLSWLPGLMAELRELGKLIKDESLEPDRLVPLALVLLTDKQEEQRVNDVNNNSSSREEYGNAIRICIYHCRASLCEDVDIDKAINYYRKCVSVRSTRLDSQTLQHSAKIALHSLIAEKNFSMRPKLPSRSSSVSSGASSSCSMACSNCGVEKRGMPVCSKCKSQCYCSVRCLRAHRPVHELECHH